MRFIVCFTLLISSLSFAANTNINECQNKLKNKQSEMNVISSNIANISTTRIPDGGAYHKQQLICKNENCEIVTHNNFITKYLPEHIDADDSGYVKFPDIKIEEEINAMLAATIAYEKIVTDCK